MSTVEKWVQKRPCPACGEHIVCDLLGTDEGDQDDLVHTIRSHLSKDVIIWSSDPKSLPPTLGYQPKDVPGSLFFVKTPRKSDALRGWEEELNKAAQIIDSATAILIVAGAGIGVDSGLPDYRGPSGFWRAYPAIEKLGLTIEDISHPDWFSKDPLFAWGFYGHRIDLYKKALPHEGFNALKEIVDAKNGNYFIFTSNISLLNIHEHGEDGQFQKAGFDAERIYECHGSLDHLQCLEGCGFSEVWELNSNGVPEVDQKTMKARKSTVPKCPKCNATARPNVSMFGDTSASWNPTRAEKQRHKLLTWLKESFPYSHEGKFDNTSTESSSSTNSLSFPHASPTIITTTTNNTTNYTTRNNITTNDTTTTKVTQRRSKRSTNGSNNDNTTVNVNISSVEYEESVDIVQKTTLQLKRENTDQTTTNTTKKKKTNNMEPMVTTRRRSKKEDKETVGEEPTTATTRTKTRSEPMVTRKRGRLMDLERQGKRLVIIECGCGVSLHSIRIESEALLRNSHETDKGERVRLVRLNPTDWQVPPSANVGLGLGAKAGLQSILQRLGCITRDIKQT